MPKIRMKTKQLVGIGLLCLSLLLSGCAKTVTLTTEEEDAIAAFSANVISKFNRYMGKGQKAVVLTDEDEKEKTTEETPKDSPEDTADNASDTQNQATSDGGNGDNMENADTKSLTDVIAIDGVSFSYAGAKVNADLSVSDVFAISPDRGKKFLVATFNVKNDSGAAKEVDLRSQKLRFTAGIAGGNYASDGTANALIPSELTAFNDTIDAGATKELMVIFQVPQDAPDDLSGLKLGVRKDKTIYQIKTS